MPEATPPKKKTYVYVDGFNLYYGQLKESRYKWLNLFELSKIMLTHNEVLKVKYFTANITPRPNDPTAPVRQQMYLRALKTVPEIETHLGHFLTHEKSMAVVTPPPNYIKVYSTNEKGSDVNLASHLLIDAFLNKFECAVVVSNDSDLAYPMQQVRMRFNKTVGMINPQERVSRTLAGIAQFCKDVRPNNLSRAQFPEALTDSNGTFYKPSIW